MPSWMTELRDFYGRRTKANDFFRNVNPQLMSYGRRYANGANWLDAEDVRQDMAIALWSFQKREDITENSAVFVHISLKRATSRFARRRYARAKTLVYDEDTLLTIPHDESSVDERAHARREARRALQACKTAEECEVLLRLYAGNSVPVIAERLDSMTGFGLSLEARISRVRRAINKIRERMEARI